MMETAEMKGGLDPALSRIVRVNSVFAERQVCARTIIIVGINLKRAPQMCLTDNDQMIQALLV